MNATPNTRRRFWYFSRPPPPRRRCARDRPARSEREAWSALPPRAVAAGPRGRRPPCRIGVRSSPAPARRRARRRQARRCARRRRDAACEGARARPAASSKPAARARRRELPGRRCRADRARSRWSPPPPGRRRARRQTLGVVLGKKFAPLRHRARTRSAASDVGGEGAGRPARTAARRALRSRGRRAAAGGAGSIAGSERRGRCRGGREQFAAAPPGSPRAAAVGVAHDRAATPTAAARGDRRIEARLTRLVLPMRARRRPPAPRVLRAFREAAAANARRASTRDAHGDATESRGGAQNRPGPRLAEPLPPACAADADAAFSAAGRDRAAGAPTRPFVRRTGAGGGRSLADAELARARRPPEPFDAVSPSRAEPLEKAGGGSLSGWTTLFGADGTFRARRALTAAKAHAVDELVAPDPAKDPQPSTVRATARQIVTGSGYARRAERGVEPTRRRRSATGAAPSLAAVRRTPGGPSRSRAPARRRTGAAAARRRDDRAWSSSTAATEAPLPEGGESRRDDVCVDRSRLP